MSSGWGSRDAGQYISSSSRLAQTTRDSNKVPRVRIKLARPLEAQTQTSPSIPSVILYWPKQVTRRAGSRHGGIDSSNSIWIIENKAVAIFWFLPYSPVSVNTSAAKQIDQRLNENVLSAECVL